MKRSIRINFKDNTYKDLELSKATAIKSDVGIFHLDKLSDGKWRLTFSNDVANDFSLIENIDIIRED
jgi:hypothetical protein